MTDRNEACDALTRLSAILGDLEEFGDKPRGHSHMHPGYVRRQARRAQEELERAARALGLKVE